MNLSNIQFPGQNNFLDDVSFSSSSINPFENEDNIHIHMVQNGRKKITMVNGLVFKDKKNENQFLKDSQQFFATSGYFKLIPEINKNTKIPCFQGDIRYDLADYLVENYHKSRDFIHIHGT